MEQNNKNMVKKMINLKDLSGGQKNFLKVLSVMPEIKRAHGGQPNQADIDMSEGIKEILNEEKTVRKFYLSISPRDPREVAIWNRVTGDFAQQSLKSMKAIKKRFKAELNCANDMCFSFMNEENRKELESMLPKHYISS